MGKLPENIEDNKGHRHEKKHLVQQVLGGPLYVF